jgi:phosphosulfolactate synthase (CoM biosynthesis protein A)
MKLKIGQYVRHVKFGWGTILEDDGKGMLVFFRNVGIKKIAITRETFSLIGGQAQKKTAS